MNMLIGPKTAAETRAATRGLAALRLMLAGSVAMLPMSALAAQEAPSSSTTPASEESGDIIVTAQRRSQSIQDVPYNISAVSGGDLARSGVVGVNSLTQVVAGLVTVDNGPATRGGTNNFTLRGLRTDNPDGADQTPQTVSSVSTYFGDVPVFFPIVLKDIQRVEVLRGPQGTLYGSGAQGGTIRFIPNRPNFDRVSGEINGGGGFTDRSGKANGSADGMLNLPLSGNFAIRAVGGINHLGGFIDAVDLLQRDGPGLFAGVTPSNPRSITSAPIIAPVKRDVNTSNEYFGRLGVRWKPDDAVDLQVDYVHQVTRVDDIQAANPAYRGGVVDLGYDFGYRDSAFVKRPGGKYESTFPIRQPSRNRIDLVSGTASVDFGLATFTAVSAYVDNDTTGIYEYSNFWSDASDGLGGYISNYGGYPRFIAVTEGSTHEKSFTQEVRLVSSWDKPIDYVVGGFFQNQRVALSSRQTAPGMAAFGLATGFPSASPESGDVVYNPTRRSRFLDRALFGEVTWHVTPELQITGGARFFWQQFAYFSRTTNDYCGAPCSDGITQPASLGIVQSSNTSRVKDHIVKVNASYDFSRSLKVYATYAEGFRRGGANGLPTAGYYRSLPIYTTYRPDVAKTYEFGMKGAAFDRRLQFSADVYRIDLNDFQFSATTPSYASGVFNGDQARSKGVEVEATVRATDRFTLGGAYTYTDARVSKSSSLLDYPAFSIVNGRPPFAYLTLSKGARLPGVPRHTFNLSGDYTLPVSDKSLIGHVDGAYRSGALGAIAATDPSFWVIDAFFTANARLTLDSNRSWAVDLFANNITNALGATAAVGLQYVPNSFAGRTVMRPRTYGTQLHFRF